MKNLIAINWFIIRKYKTFWILLGLYILTTIGINGIVSNLQETVRTQTSGNIQLDVFSAPHLWNTTGWLTGFALLLPCFIVIVLTTNEYTYKTLKQSIINGLRREQLVFSKWLFILCLALFCWLVYFFTTVFIGWSLSATGTLFSGFQFAGFTFLKIFLSLSIAFVLSILLKRSGLTIALFLVYYFLMEGIIGHYLNKITPYLGDFLPLSTGSHLVPNPFNEFIFQASNQAPANYWFVWAGIGWIILLISLSFLYFRRADL